jgi:hypothetical protein
MTLTILDPCTGDRVTIEVAPKAQPRRIRRWLLRELDRSTEQHRKPSSKQQLGVCPIVGGVPQHCMYFYSATH